MFWNKREIGGNFEKDKPVTERYGNYEVHNQICFVNHLCKICGNHIFCKVFVNFSETAITVNVSQFFTREQIYFYDYFCVIQKHA